jgi:hypothetical protein
MPAPSPIVDRYLTFSAEFKPFYTSSLLGGFFVFFCAHLLFFSNFPHFSILKLVVPFYLFLKPH